MLGPGRLLTLPRGSRASGPRPTGAAGAGKRVCGRQPRGASRRRPPRSLSSAGPAAPCPSRLSLHVCLLHPLPACTLPRSRARGTVMCFQHFHFLNSCSAPSLGLRHQKPSLRGSWPPFFVKFDAGLGSPAWHFSATFPEPFYSKWKGPSPLLRAPGHLPARPPPCRDVRSPHSCRCPRRSSGCAECPGAAAPQKSSLCMKVALVPLFPTGK